jgi:hypothetical protein
MSDDGNVVSFRQRDRKWLGQIPEDDEKDLDRSIEMLAAMEIVPIWDFSSEPGPSHQQWNDWNNSHGVTLRMASGFMMMTKDRLGDTAGTLGDNVDDMLDTLEHSRKFFTDMAKVVLAAQIRLMIGVAVHARRNSSE